MGRRRQHFRGNVERLNTISAFWRQRRVIGKRRQHFRSNAERLNTISAFWRQRRVIAGRAGHFEDDSRVMRWRTSVLVLTGHFLKRYLAREYPISAALLAAFAFCALVLAFSLPNPLCHSPPTLLTGRIEMAPKRKTSSSSAVVIPPINPNSQLPFAGNHMFVISEPELLHLVSIGALPPRELCS
jgi:hypothetical protein